MSIFSVALVGFSHGFRDAVVRELMMDFAEWDQGIVIFGLGESLFVVEDLGRLVAIFVGAFSVGLRKG
ncbi:MAG: hypothetical protein WC285_03835 [Candidatus Gracilibacteria bacterium]